MPAVNVLFTVAEAGVEDGFDLTSLETLRLA